MEHHLLIETTSKTDWQGQSQERTCQIKQKINQDGMETLLWENGNFVKGKL